MAPSFVERELKQFWSATDKKERLKRLQHISQMVNWVDDETLKDLAKDTQLDKNPGIRGEMCYALGRTGKARFRRMIHPLIDDPEPWVQKQARNAVERLKMPKPILRDDNDTEVLWSELSEIRKHMGTLSNEVLKLSKEVAKIHHESAPWIEEVRRLFEEFEKNRKAYERLEASLLKKYHGKFVAFCKGKLASVGVERIRVIQEAMRAYPSARPYIRQVGQKIQSKPRGRR